MSFPGDSPHPPMDGSDPLQNLSVVQARIDAIQKFLSHSVNTNTLIGKDRIEMVSSEISAAIHQIIVNGAALLSSAAESQNNLHPHLPKSQTAEKSYKPQVGQELKDDGGGEDYDIIELDAVELLAEHIHFCEICGKGFRRGANLRMHMRAHGDQFKTLEALSKPETEKLLKTRSIRSPRFSCPFVDCNRNKQHKKFRPLKSVVCVKNHFKRSHCPKMYTCTKCNKKSFSVVADLKSHQKHCGETKWKCCCGTSFSRKDKLFGHMALFEGHMPAVMVEEEEEAEAEEPETKEVDMDFGSKDFGMYGRLIDDLGGSSENYYSFQEVFGGSPNDAANGWFVQ